MEALVWEDGWQGVIEFAGCEPLPPPASGRVAVVVVVVRGRVWAKMSWANPPSFWVDFGGGLALVILSDLS